MDIEIVTEVLVEKNGDIGQKRKPAEKLAPLFTKKSKPDPEVVNARRLFLQSDMKETENRATKQQKPVPGESSMPFPKISHVAQLGTEELRKTDCELALKMVKTKSTHVMKINLNVFQFFFLFLFVTVVEDREKARISSCRLQDDKQHKRVCHFNSRR